MKQRGPNSTLRTIHLHGSLGEKYGREHQLAVIHAQEALRALMFLYPDFRKDLTEGSWQVVRGAPETGMNLDETSIAFGLGKQPLHIIPAPIGAGKGGGKIIIGIALVALAWYMAPVAGSLAVVAGAEFGGAAGLAAVASAGMGATAFLGITYGQIALVGAALALSGIASMVAPAPRTNIGQQGVDQKGSFTLTGAQNTAVEGTAVPIVYGRVRVGSVVGAATMTIADYSASSPTPSVDAGEKTGAGETHSS